MLVSLSSDSLRVKGRTEEPVLPMDYQVVHNRGSLLVESAIGIIFIGFGVYTVTLDLSSLNTTLGILLPIVIIAPALVVIAQSAWRWTRRRRVRIAEGHVVVVDLSLLGQEEWKEPLESYRGIRWGVRQQKRGGGGEVRREIRYSHVLELDHPSPGKTILLHHSTRAQRWSEDVRSDWEALARLLELPAIDAREGRSEVRAPTELDKSLSDLHREGRLTVEAPAESPPTDIAVQEEGATVELTLLARRFSLWEYGGVLIAGTALLLIGGMESSLPALLIGIGLAAGLFWGWSAEKCNPRCVRINSTSLEFDKVAFGAGMEAVDAGEIEGVSVVESFIGREVVVQTDAAEHRIGRGLSEEGAEYLRHIILKSVGAGT